MTETTRVLLVAAILAAAGLAAYAVRVLQQDPAEPARLIGELRFSQWAALLLAVSGGAWLGIAAAHPPAAMGGVEVTLAIATIVAAAWTLHVDTRQALVALGIAFVVHALLDTAPRPGWLAADLAPRGFIVGCAVHNVFMAAVCYGLRRR
jgi:hypothetical protein